MSENEIENKISSDLPHNAEWYAAQLEAFRRNVARWIVFDYIRSPSYIAEFCDTKLDRSGVLLGYVREEAVKINSQAG